MLWIPRLSTAFVAAAQPRLSLRRRFGCSRVLCSAEPLLQPVSVAQVGDHASPSTRSFQQLNTALSPPIKRALETKFGYDKMSKVQDSVLSLLPVSLDLLVRARTGIFPPLFPLFSKLLLIKGTGKTLAFLIAAIESLNPKLFSSASKPQSRPGQRTFDFETSIVIISPTRELANQIAAEAKRLLYYHPFEVALMVGGDSKGKQINMMRRNGGQVVVATPGRFLDILYSTPEFPIALKNTSVLILDECDQLLDMGFRRELQEIQACLPKSKQTFLFSATFGKNIVEIARNTLHAGYLTVDTVPKNEVATHARVKQSFVISPYNQFVASVVDAITKHRETHGNATKIVVFLPTTTLTNLFAAILRAAFRKSFNVFEIHSKLEQSRRSRVSDSFRQASSPVMLVTTDVSARGVDYPGVTLVLQLFSTVRQQYIHRVGRTGRAGKKGEGMIVLAPYEKFMLNELQGLPIEKSESVVAQFSACEYDGNVFVQEAMAENMNNRTNLKMSKEAVVAACNEFATVLLGLPEPPSLSSRFLENLGLARIAGIKVRSNGPRYEDGESSQIWGNNSRYDARYARDSNSNSSSSGYERDSIYSVKNTRDNILSQGKIVEQTRRTPTDALRRNKEAMRMIMGKDKWKLKVEKKFSGRAAY
ncbi:hypothetical protein HK096_004823, partial [Nowakowskiella sp. JEL0078]